MSCFQTSNPSPQSQILWEFLFWIIFCKGSLCPSLLQPFPQWCCFYLLCGFILYFIHILCGVVLHLLVPHHLLYGVVLLHNKLCIFYVWQREKEDVWERNVRWWRKKRKERFRKEDEKSVKYKCNCRFNIIIILQATVTC